MYQRDSCAIQPCEKTKDKLYLYLIENLVRRREVVCGRLDVGRSSLLEGRQVRGVRSVVRWDEKKQRKSGTMMICGEIHNNNKKREKNDVSLKKWLRRMRRYSAKECSRK